MREDTDKPREKLSVGLDALAREVVDSAYKVHSALGPGLLEGVYEVCLTHELGKRSIKVERQKVLPVVYDGIRIDAGLRLDLRVEGLLVVELKAVEKVAPVHIAQMLTYLKLTGCRLGLLVNFNVPRIKDGIRRIALYRINNKLDNTSHRCRCRCRCRNRRRSRVSIVWLDQR